MLFLIQKSYKKPKLKKIKLLKKEINDAFSKDLNIEDVTKIITKTMIHEIIKGKRICVK